LVSSARNRARNFPAGSVPGRETHNIRVQGLGVLRVSRFQTRV
jgi:hypothetical protein